MRSRAEKVAAIKVVALEAVGASAVVRLFGSRVDDRLRGGESVRCVGRIACRDGVIL